VRGREVHFRDELWSDFVRKVVTPADEAAMRAHLDAGCALCARTVEVLGAVARFGAEESSFEVPEDVTARARALFEPRGAGNSWTEKLERKIAELIWVTQPGWQPQGVRSAGESGPRMLYRSGEYSVDLSIETQAGAPGEIVGQIANERDQDEDLGGILVQVVTTGRTLSETATNQFGEFIIEYPAAKHTVLRLALRHRGQRIDVPLHTQ
jgi:hypothetical protein